MRHITNISESKEHIQGICSAEKALRTFRKDRILEEITDSTNIDERFEFHVSNNPPQIPSLSTRNTAHKIEICFTGFKKDDKERLIKLAKSSEMFVCANVTKNLDFLCCGYNAGPKKIEKSRHQGVVVLSEAQLKYLIETGEIPEDA